MRDLAQWCAKVDITMITAGPHCHVHFRMTTRNLVKWKMKPNAKVRNVCADVPCRIACTQCVLYSTEQECVVATSNFPPRVSHYDASGSTNGFNHCEIANGQTTQKFGETCALKCEDGYQGSPLLYCAAGVNKTSVPGSRQYQNASCTRKCHRSCCSNRQQCCVL